MKYYLYNKLANNGIPPKFEKDANIIQAVGLDYQKFFDGLNKEDEVVLVGGDGTLNYFVNAIDTDKLTNNIYYLPAGTGNDFANDLNVREQKEFLINDYIKNLPTVYVNGLVKKFINGIGYGIDGYVCEEADRIKERKPHKKINYTLIAIKGLLFTFKPVTATVCVDGEEFTYKNVWLAPSMKGRFYGGGMMIAPGQDRNQDDLTIVNYLGKSKLKTMLIFPSIFKGGHVSHTDVVKIHKGKEITVKFDRPCALQIDGGTVTNVLTYTVKA